MRNNTKSFSLIEIIFAIIIIAVITTIALPKLFNIQANSNIIKLKSDLAMIQNGLKNFKNKNILQNNEQTLETLEDDSSLLFNTILEKPIISDTSLYPHWLKKSNTLYLFVFDNSTNLEFDYDANNLNFTCDKTDELCIKVLE